LKSKLNILICPLEWGLGHAGRMVPFAKRLQELNCNIIFGSGEEHITFLQGELPEATYIHFPGFRIKYSRYFPQYLVILFRLPLLLWHTILEHHRLKKIIKDYSIDIIVSDNRIGLWNSKIKSVFVTHQLRIPFPFPFRFLEPAGRYIVRSIIKKYTLCFIPDLPGDLNVSGRLCHGFRLPENVRFIGILSRFGNQPFSDNLNLSGYVIILSGPEPQRSLLRQKLTSIVMAQDVPVVILLGEPGKPDDPFRKGNFTYYNHLSSGETINLLRKSEGIISRSGYTTIMELISLRKSALLIPTPGQTEQEYLADYLSDKGWFNTVKQNSISENMDIKTGSGNMPEGIMEESEKLLAAALSELSE
jgi:uncharacterized protein (TIGR00661 family)